MLTYEGAAANPEAIDPAEAAAGASRVYNKAFSTSSTHWRDAMEAFSELRPALQAAAANAPANKDPTHSGKKTLLQHIADLKGGAKSADRQALIHLLVAKGARPDDATKSALAAAGYTLTK